MITGSARKPTGYGRERSQPTIKNVRAEMRPRGGVAAGRRCHPDGMAREHQVTESELAELVSRMDEAAAAYIRGDIHHYLSLFDHPDDYTLMPPYGGETTYGYAYTEEGAAETSRFFASGEATLDLQHSYVSGDLAVLVAVERQHGEVGGFPEQDWSLRVTLVFRRAGDRWEIVHRHADPLVRQIPFEHLARLARGLDGDDRTG
jgi:ketosteroid isomerase-like protein